MRLFLFIGLLFFMACSNPSESDNGKTDGQEENDGNTQDSETSLDKTLLGQWELDKIEGEDFVIEEQNGLQKTPLLIIIAQESRFQGSDGCNNMAGAVNNSEKGSIEFSKIAKTKMACMNMEIPDRFTNALNDTKKYKVEEESLFLLSESDKELLSFEKKE